MIDYVVKVENKFVGDALSIFIDNYKEHIATFLNNVLKGETGSADAFITKGENGQVEMYQFAPDKGVVLGQVEANGPVSVCEYKELPLDAKYIVYDGQHLKLYLKQPDGQSDLMIGRFLNFTEAIKQIDSENVTTTIHTVKAAIKNADIERRKIEKKAAKLKKQLVVND